MKKLLSKKLKALSVLVAVTTVNFGNFMPVMAAEHVFGGTVYYVDSANGNDENNGQTEKTAWKTLDKVNATEFMPGDKLLFERGGVWHGLLWPKGSGAEGSPIVIDSYGNKQLGKPIINGSGTSTKNPENETGEGSALFLYNQAYWEISNLEVTNCSFAEGEATGHRTGVRVLAKDAGTVSHIYLRNIDVHDVKGDYSDVFKRSGGIQFNISGTITPTKYDDIRIEGCTVKNVSRTGIQVGVSSWKNRHNYNSGAGDWYPSTNVVVRNCFVDTIGGDGILTRECKGQLVEYNLAKDCNYDGKAANVAIWPWNSDDAVLQYNEAYNTRYTNDGQGFDCDYLCYDTTIQYNYSHDNEGGFILICSPESESVNIDNVIRYNVSQNDRCRVFEVMGPGTDNTMIYNNTIYLDEKLKDEGVKMVSHRQWGGYSRNTYYYNNIFYNMAEASYIFGYSTNNVFENNCFVGGPLPEESSQVTLGKGNLVLSAEEAKQVGFAGWVGTGGTGIDFKDENRLSCYKLTEDSVCINAGKKISDNGGYDFWKNPLYNGDPDIGAFEYQDKSFIASPDKEDMAATKYLKECEELTYATPVRTGIYKDVACSGGKNVGLLADRVGESIEFTLDVPAAGFYEVRIGTKRATNGGKFVCYAGNIPIGEEQDTYSDAISFPEESLGVICFEEAGDMTFRFEITGKNSKSSGYHVFFDYIVLVPEYDGMYECEALEVTASIDRSTILDEGASGGAMDDWQFMQAENQYVEYTLPSVSAGKYRIKAGTRHHVDKGTCALSIDGVRQGEEQDQWDSRNAWAVQDFGEVELTESGNKTFRFDLTGKNEHSSGYGLIFDSILLERVSEVSLVRIQLTPPEKLRYAVRENLDWSGGGVMAVYSDGTTQLLKLEDCEVSDFDSKTVGEKTVTVSYEGKKSSFTVIVKERGTYECEDLEAEIAKGVRVRGNMVARTSGGKADSFESCSVGASIEYTVPAVDAGTYLVRIGIRSHANKGKYQLSIDGVNQGTEQDQYTPSGQVLEQNLGEVEVGMSGDKKFKFTVTGQNESSTDCCLMFDYILLERVDEVNK